MQTRDLVGKLKEFLVFTISRSGGLLFIYASILQFIWAVLILINPVALLVTPLLGLTQLVGVNHISVASILFISNGLAFYFLVIKRLTSSHFFLLIPQQCILLLSAFGSLQAVILGHYADGVSRPSIFILADQLPNILIALLYTVAVLGWFNTQRNGI